MRTTPQEAWQLLESAEIVFSTAQVNEAVKRVGAEITATLGDTAPLVLSVMGGAVVFTGQLLPLLRFPLDFDYIHASRYNNETTGNELKWRMAPRENVIGRTVLVLDDILDEGHTLAAIKEKVLALGAKGFYCAVLTEKDTGRPKPIAADFVGLKVPDRYVFGYGMDAYGLWRNLPAIYALKNK